MVYKVTVSFHLPIIRYLPTCTNVSSTCFSVCLELYLDGAVVAPSFQYLHRSAVFDEVWLSQTDGAPREVPPERPITGRRISVWVPLGYTLP